METPLGVTVTNVAECETHYQDTKPSTLSTEIDARLQLALNKVLFIYDI